MNHKNLNLSRRATLLAQLALINQVIDSTREEARRLLEKRSYSEAPRRKLAGLDRQLLIARRSRARLDLELSALREADQGEPL